jgi:hypothetical protein
MEKLAFSSLYATKLETQIILLPFEIEMLADNRFLVLKLVLMNRQLQLFNASLTCDTQPCFSLAINCNVRLIGVVADFYLVKCKHIKLLVTADCDNMETGKMCCNLRITGLTASILLISTLIPNYTVSLSAYRHTSPVSFEALKNSTHNSLFEFSSSTDSIFRTAIVSYVGDVNVSDLQRPISKPFVGINSGDSYLTRNFSAYKAAKMRSEIIIPGTRVFEIKPPFALGISGTSLHNKQHPLSIGTEANISSLVLSKFEGLAQNCCNPPDVQVGAGAKYVAEMVNLDGAVYAKNGTLLKSFGLEFLFDPRVKGFQGSDVRMSDPTLLFDNASERWFASISDIHNHSIRVAVSETDDPKEVWRIYNFPFGGDANSCSDQPFIGISKDKFVVTTNDWDNDCNWRSDNKPPEFSGVQFAVADKTDLLRDLKSVRAVQSEPELSYFSLRPVLTLSPTTSLLMATVADFNHTNVQVFYIDGPLYDLHINSVFYPIQDSHVPSDGLQPTIQSTTQITSGKYPKVSTGDARIQSAVWYQGRLWLAFNDGCFVVGDTMSRSCVRLIEVDTVTSKVIQDVDIGAVGSSLYYPAISLDTAGNLGIIFGYSSPSIYPSILVTTRLSTDELSSVKDPQTLKLGTANELSNRYGDYFAASSDPSTTSVIWMAGEYHLTATWSTIIGQVKLER